MFACVRADTVCVVSANLSVIEGGARPLSKSKFEAVSALTSLVRGLPDEQAETLVKLLEEFKRDRYSARLRPDDIPVIKVLAEVISGWDPEGVYEFACAWASTLVARQDGHSWDTATPSAKQHHRERVHQELVRRGIA